MSYPVTMNAEFVEMIYFCIRKIMIFTNIGHSWKYTGEADATILRLFCDYIDKDGI